MSDEITVPEPLFTAPIAAPYATNDVASALGRCGVPYSTAHARARIFAKEGFIHARARAGTKPTSARLFSVTELGVAKVLSDLQDMGVQDHDTLRAAALGCYAWHKGREPSQKSPSTIHPILAAMSGVLKGESWTFRLDVFRKPTQVFPVATVYSEGQVPDLSKFYEPSSGWIPVGAFVCAIDKDWLPMIAPLTAN